MPKSVHYDCYKGSKLIGYFEIYSDYNYLNKPKEHNKEIYIEVLEKYQCKGYAKDIYNSFIIKRNDLGYSNSKLFAYVLNTNIASIALHTSLKFKVVKKLKKYTLFEVK